MIMIKPNAKALKAVENMKVDFKFLYSRAMGTFESSGELSEGYKEVAKELGGYIDSLKENIRLLDEEYKSLYNSIFS